MPRIFPPGSFVRDVDYGNIYYLGSDNAVVLVKCPQGDYPLGETWTDVGDDDEIFTNAFGNFVPAEPCPALIRHVRSEFRAT